MTRHDEPPPLPPELDALLEAERPLDDPDPAVRQAILESVHRTVSAPPPGAGAIPRARAIQWGALLLVTGFGAGMLVHHVLDARRAPPPAEARPPAVSAAPLATSGPTESPPREAPTTSPPAPASAASAPRRPSAPAAASPATSAPGTANLAAERTLLDRAHAAMLRGDGRAALEAVDLHARSFPRGSLSEERELLAVQALAGQGRAAEAKARAARFHQAFPRSVYGGAIDALVP